MLFALNVQEDGNSMKGTVTYEDLFNQQWNRCGVNVIEAGFINLY